MTVTDTQIGALLDENGIDKLVGEAINDDYTHDEALGHQHQRPAALVFPTSTDQVAQLVRLASEHQFPITARGAGTGLNGSAVAGANGLLLGFEKMNKIIEIDTQNHVAVVQPGVTLAQLEEETARHGLVYPVYPGEMSATLGGNVATNAGGMRAVKYGVTRHQVLGLEAVLADGSVIRTGGKFVKATTGYDLTQLIVGSEGTLAVVTEITLRLYPRPTDEATILVPFSTLEDVTKAIPSIVNSGINPLLLEYVDMIALQATTASQGLDLGIPDQIKDTALAYLIITIEGHSAARVEEDAEATAELVGELGALDVYLLPPHAASALLDAREKAFFVAKQMGVNDIIDVVVPRASIPEYLDTVSGLAQQNGAFIAGAGHAGDGNVHLSIFQPDDQKLSDLMTSILGAGIDLGGTISAEHGIGFEKKKYFHQLIDPNAIALMRRIKAAFDPQGILNPGVML